MLVHNGLTTLDVLAIGLLMVALFEVTLGGPRTYLFSHTTNRVDVELGARLYHHLQRLPISFFQSRPVGTVVARMRELETVRSFVTGSALTVGIDAVFTIVFLAVMYFYSATLFWIVFDKDIGFVRAGQSAMIKIEAFPFTRYGVIEGTVTSVSNDAIADEKLGLYYAARVRFVKPTMLVDGADLLLSPGMAVTAEVTTGTRRLIEYVLSPVMEHTSESGKER